MSDTVVRINSVDQTAIARLNAASIHATPGPSANKGQLTFNASPEAGQQIEIALVGSPERLLFAGEIQAVRETYDGNGYPRFDTDLIDQTFQANRRRPFGTWVDTSATTVALAIAAEFAPGCTTTGIAAGLPAISINFDGSQPFMTCLQAIASAINGRATINYANDLGLFLTDPYEQPDPIDDSHRPLDDPPIAFTTDLSQVRTRIYGKGYTGTIQADVLAGDTTVPIADADLVMFNAAGGKAIAGTVSGGAQTQILDYTGVQSGGGGSLVGPGAAPSSPPTAKARLGSALTAAIYKFGYTFITASGESLPSPVATANLTTSPDAPTAASGWFNGWGSLGGGVFPNGGTWIWGFTCLMSDGSETTVVTQTVTNNTGSSAGGASFFPLGGIPAGAASIKVYRTVNGGSTLKLVGTVSVATMESTGYGDNTVDGSLGADIATGRSAVVTFAIGPSGVTSRKLYRTAAAGSQLKLQATVANNAATSASDATADGSLGANAPTSDLSGLTQPSGQVNAGSNALPVANAAPFATEGGWASLSGQIIRYTGIGNQRLQSIAFDAGVAGGFATATSLTWSHTCGGSNRYLLVAAVDNAGSDLVTGVTYAGVSMVLIQKVVSGSGGSIRTIYLYGLVNPASGANNVVVSASASIALAGCSASYTGVDQSSSTPDNSTTGVSSATASFAVSLTPHESNCWVVGFLKDDAGDPSAGTSTTLRAHQAVGGIGLCDNNAPVTPASTTLTLTQSSTAWSGIVVSLTPLIGGSALSGIPVSGSGAILTPVTYGAQVAPAPAIVGITTSGSPTSGVPVALAKGSTVAIWVQRDDTSAQTALAALEGADGIREDHLFDGRLAEDTLIATCDARLAQFSLPTTSVEYATLDPKTRPGATVSVALTKNGSPYGLTGDFTIQDVTVSFIGKTNRPRFQVRASSTAFTLMDLLRLAAITAG